MLCFTSLFVLFTTDEEIGRGADKVDLAKLGARFAYTLDGSTVGEIENETFSADGVTIVMSTHNLGQATRLGDDIVFMAAGRVCEHTAVQPFFARPRSEEARLFIQGELPWRMRFPGP